MKSPYTLPALCTVAIHAAFLVVFEEPTRTDPADPDGPVVLPVSKSVTLFLPPPPPPDEVVDATVRPKSESKPMDPQDFVSRSPTNPPPRPNPGNLRPMQPDLVTLGESTFVQTVRDYTSNGEWGDNLSGRFDSAFTPAALDRIPETRLRVAPHYPEAMRQIGREAEVVVTFVVNRDGEVIEARADREAAPEFARAAERALLRWRFEPGRRNGQPVPFRMSIPLLFSISDR